MAWSAWHQAHPDEKAKCAMGNKLQEAAESLGQFSWDRFGLMSILLRAGYQIAIFLSKLWKIEQTITTLAVSGKMCCKLMEVKDMILQSIWHSYNQCVLGAKIWSSQRDQFWAPIDKDGFQIWLVELTGTNSLMWICISGAMVRFQLAEGPRELSLKAQLKG